MGESSPANLNALTEIGGPGKCSLPYTLMFCHNHWDQINKNWSDKLLFPARDKENAVSWIFQAPKISQMTK